MRHYAKNMCHNCYNRKGKSRLATSCPHTDRPHYSGGMCQSCYLAKYYLKRKQKNLEKAKKQEQKNAVSKDAED